VGPQLSQPSEPDSWSYGFAQRAAAKSYAQATGDIFTAEYSPGLNAEWKPVDRGINFHGGFFPPPTNVAHGGVTVFHAECRKQCRKYAIPHKQFQRRVSAETTSLLVNAITKSGTNEFSRKQRAGYHTNKSFVPRASFFQPSVPVFRRKRVLGQP